MESELDPRIVAHRGWTETHVENTLAAFQAARDRGCRGVELDVRRCADREWVVFHDRDLIRLHGRPERLKDHSAAALCDIVAVPRLPDALEIFGPECTPFIEVKDPETAGVETLAEEIRPFADHYELIVIARGREMPRALAGLLPDTPLLLYTRDWEEAAGFTGWHIRGFDLPGAEVDPTRGGELVQTFHERGQRLAVWTINDRAEGDRWLADGVDWLITDRPWLWSAVP